VFHFPHKLFSLPSCSVLNAVFKQVYLLTPMNRAMLFNAKSTISHCPPSLITRQLASVDSKLLETEKCWSLPLIWTIMLKLHLVDLLSIRYTTNLATNTVTNWTDGAYALVYRSTSNDRWRWDKQWSVVDLIDPRY